MWEDATSSLPVRRYASDEGDGEDNLRDDIDVDSDVQYQEVLAEECLEFERFYDSHDIDAKGHCKWDMSVKSEGCLKMGTIVVDLDLDKN